MNITAAFNFTFCGENVVFVENDFFRQKLSHMLQVPIIICSDVGLALFRLQFSVLVCRKKKLYNSNWTDYEGLCSPCFAFRIVSYKHHL